jgi:hypothetical protein
MNHTRPDAWQRDPGLGGEPASAEGARSEAASASEPAEVGGADRAEPSEAVVRASLRLAARTHNAQEG